MQKLSSLTYNDYSAGHPWYYFLGGKILMPKQILEQTRASGYKGYLADDTAAVDQKTEPTRSDKLRQLRAEIFDKIKADLSRYRQCAFALHRHPKIEFPITKVISCDDVHQAICLKHNHLVNGFAHLIYIDELLSKQGDLFGF